MVFFWRRYIPSTGSCSSSITNGAQSGKLVAGKKMRAAIDSGIGGTKRQRKSDPEPDMGIDNGAF